MRVIVNEKINECTNIRITKIFKEGELHEAIDYDGHRYYFNHHNLNKIFDTPFITKYSIHKKFFTPYKYRKEKLKRILK